MILKSQSKPSAIATLISEQLKKTKSAIIEECERLEDEEINNQINEYLSDSERIYKRNKSNPWDEIFDRSRYTLPSESEYLLKASQCYWLAQSREHDKNYEWALTFIIRAEKYLGMIAALLTLRQVNAARANKENIEMKKQATEFWEKNIDKTLSNDKAAAILAKQLPLSTRVLSRYVSEAKKFRALVKEIEARRSPIRFIKETSSKK